MTVDVAARLAAGRTSVTNTQTYVSACHAVGYQHPDMTAHAAQIVEWYCGEDGLDLHALDADCALLRSAATAADEALRLAVDGSAAMSAAWEGQSSSLATDFIDRHCAAGTAVARALHAAAGACEMLRDILGRLVDEKVAAAVSIDDRRAAERPAWLAAAAAVTGGGAGRDEAVEIVTHQITPYVDADIRTEWLTAMRSATASVAAAYEDALRQLNGSAAAYFEVPGQFGSPPVPASSPVASDASVASAAEPVAAQTVPAAAALPPAADPAPAPSTPVPDAAPAQPLPPTPPTTPLAGAGGGAPAGVPAMPDDASGLSGLVGQIADALGGLVEGIPDNAAPDDKPGLEEPVEQADDQTDDGVIEPEAKEEVPENVPIAEDPDVDEPQPVDEPVVTDAAPAAPPPDPQPEPLAAEQPDEPTPCEIAADELAQVGQ